MLKTVTKVQFLFIHYAAYRKIFPAIKIHDSYYALTDYGESLALQHNLDFTDIYSNSWGSSDDGETMEAPGPLTRDALKEAVEKVRVLVFTSFTDGLQWR